MTRLMYGASIVLCATCTVPLLAESNDGAADDPVSSFDQLWTKVKSGDTIYVLGTDARETSGTFAKVSQTSLAMLVDGQIREIALSDVRQVARRGDSLRNGALIGAAFGVVVGFIGGDEGCLDSPCAGRAAVAVVAGGVYAAIGAGIDALIHGRTVVYRTAKQQNVRVTPILSGNHAGASLSVKF